MSKKDTTFICKGCIDNKCILTVGDKGPYDDPELCPLNSLEDGAEWEEQKPVVDEQKRRFAEAVMETSHFSEGGYLICNSCNGEINHDDNCIYHEAKQYLESLEGE